MLEELQWNTLEARRKINWLPIFCKILNGRAEIKTTNYLLVQTVYSYSYAQDAKKTEKKKTKQKTM